MMTKILQTPTASLALSAALLLLPMAMHANAQKKEPGGIPETAAPSSQPTSSPATSAAADGSTQEPDRAQAYYHTALAGMYEDDAVSEGHPDEVTRAIEEYKLALDADPNSPELNDSLGDLYFRTGRVHDAEVTARNLLKTTPNDIDAHKLLGRIYLRELGEGQAAGSTPASANNTLEQAIAEFEKIVSLQPRDVEDRMVLGQLYNVKHDAKKAEDEFKAAQAIEPDSEDVVLNLARMYAESGDMQHAVKVIEDVPEGERTPKMEFTLGAAYEQMKQPKDAIAAYKRAEDMEPGDPQTLDALGQALLNDNQLDEALKQYKDLAAADPDNNEALVHIAEIQRRQGHYEDALATIQKARKIDPSSLEAGYNEGMILDVLGRFDEATKTTRIWLTLPRMLMAHIRTRKRTTAVSFWSGWEQLIWNGTR